MFKKLSGEDDAPSVDRSALLPEAMPNTTRKRPFMENDENGADGLAERDREKREKKATKEDDAEVPEYLWLEHLFDDDEKIWSEEAQSQLKRTAGWFRTRMLIRWKRNVFRTFGTFLKQKYPRLAEDDALFPKYALRAISQATVESSGTPPTYAWETEALDGRLAYR